MYKVPLDKYTKQNIINPEKSRKKFWIAAGAVFIFFACFALIRAFPRSEGITTEQESEILSEEAILEEKKEILVNYEVSEGDIPAEIFSKYGKFDANDTEALLYASSDVYDFSSLKIGRPLRFYFNGEEKAMRMEYDRDTERVVIVERVGQEFSVREEEIKYDVSEETVRGKIENFFYADALDLGVSEATVLEMGDIFSFSVDFTTEIKQGDEFIIIYEKRFRDGQKGPDGNILAAKFINEGTAYYAYHFDNDGNGGYYDEEGRVLERQFLKAPLSYRRITSGFTGARLHPITRTVSAHYQIDYAAPVGTPVVSTARGTIMSAGWEGGWGNMVRIRHDNGYTTHYGHLSAFAKGIAGGTKVSQGEVVGYVGSTGWSTGPHLDYGMKLNGVPVNPLKLDLPKGEPLGEEKMREFEKIKKKYERDIN
ncbi:MAG: peptidoglycan DD-metalloendopeptidase family protein [Candidatus Moranbacteria bacterium]|jgi:murein DD-endopeptidase MepM/ murein hydrolase activator NlpD|nr:peptidoglycan DD-metalloendopeptidase family protein [Candidatus Moranbacteria bacterium]MDD5651779.1 peptidoglycan DD-metalloendopeptidase family protein [Candidatus Moranbacteria bacterium]MDX9855655.1 peptidoglycan DD-metalloendopeptidase family protein [Candidatus Moranbacteria bacterium]